MSSLKPAARRVQEAAAAAGLDISVRQMPQSTRTAEEAAAACNCDVSQIVKSLIFRGKDTDTPYLLLVSGANRVNEKAVARDIGEPLKRPNADDVRQLTGYAIGGIPPLGHDTPLATFVDRDLLEHDVVWAAAGTPESLFSSAPSALVTATQAKVIEVAK